METLISILSRLPLQALYGLTNGIFFPLAYYVVRYRRKVVNKNLQLCFPEMDAKQRRLLGKRFYHWFADLIAEIIYGYRISDEELAQRVIFHGLAEREEEIKTHGGAMIMLGHIGCWEWIADVAHRFHDKDIQTYFIYHALRNESTDKAMLHLREKRGGQLIEMRPLLRRMIALREEGGTHVYCMLADQKPSRKSMQYHTLFFGHEVPFLTGTERLAARWDYPVYFARITMPKRGYYEIYFETLSSTPGQETAGAITDAFAHRVEDNIKAQPEIWLWTHNRFKYIFN